jgi:hypothetical protein
MLTSLAMMPATHFNVELMLFLTGSLSPPMFNLRRSCALVDIERDNVYVET